MDLLTTLFILRLIGALLLILFVGLVAWLIYREMRLTAALLAADQQPRGLLRVIANDSKTPAVDSVFPLLPITSIGRSASNTVVLTNDYASADHALITRRDGQWWLQDQGSRNGTLLNHIALERTTIISPGDIIAIGGTELKVESSKI